MNGTGTKNDPFVIMTAEELYHMGEYGGNDVYCRLGADISLNGTPYGENFTPIPVCCGHLDGAGHSIKNIYVNTVDSDVNLFSVTSDTTVEISNLVIENIELSALNSYVFSSGNDTGCTVELYNCTFILNVRRLDRDTSSSGSRCLLHNNLIVVNAELCTFAVKGNYEVPYSIFKNGAMKRSHLRLELTVQEMLSTSADGAAIFNNAIVTDSYFTGKIKGVGYNILMAHEDAAFSNCYHAIEYEAVSGAYWNAAFLTPCFYDADKMGSAEYRRTVNGGWYFYGLTTEQCKNADYLRSIGFIVEKGE